MCGRYNIISDVQPLVDFFEVATTRITGSYARYNIAPSSPGHRTKAPIIRSIAGQHHMDELIWPFIPVWAKGQLPKYSTANAVSETMADKPTYRDAWKRQQRCVVPASGFYEWQLGKHQKAKQPWLLRPADAPFFAIAGLWQSSFPPDEEPVESFTIVTCPANALMAEIHNSKKRMPVLLDRQGMEIWLTGSPDESLALCRPSAEEALVGQRVSTWVNTPTHDDPRCLQPPAD